MRCLPAVPYECRASDAEILLLTSARHPDVSRFLGPQLVRGKVVVRCWIRGAKEVSLSSNALLATGGPDAKEDPPSQVPMQLVDGCPAECQWLFEVAFAIECGSSLIKDTESLRIELDYVLHARYNAGSVATLTDPYSLGNLLPSDFLANWSKGKLTAPPASMFGAHYTAHRHRLWGTRFAVWAPHAEAVSVVGDFNTWNGLAHPMCYRCEAGVWEIFLPIWDLRGEKYGYHITPKNGSPIVKTDPFALEFVEPSNGAHDAKVPQCDDYNRSGSNGSYLWHDSEWLAQRALDVSSDKWSSQPLSIYEVHLGSWRTSHGNPQSYRELAEPLAAHVKEMGFTAVEFLPLSQYPCDKSLGYRCASGLYAVDSRLGTPDDFRFLIDTLHLCGIAVFMDFVAAHFAKDDWGLVCYSGEPQFEYAGALGELPIWGTARFDYSKPEVRAYLIGAAEFWIEQLHIDGLRLDNVAAMIYSCFGREDVHGNDVIASGQEDVNKDAVSFLKELCAVVRTKHPGVLIAAEESRDFQWVTSRPVGIHDRGTDRHNVKVEDLGFHLKWNVGFTDDTLSFLGMESTKRPTCTTIGWQKLTWYLAYAYNERWILPLSHDNAQKMDEHDNPRGLLQQMTSPVEADRNSQFANMRLLMSYVIGMPGRPLLFMGAEVGEGAWSHQTAIDWKAAEKDEQKSQLKRWVAKLLRLYKELPALHRQDDLGSSFIWLDKDASSRCFYCWKRSAPCASDVIVMVNVGTEMVRCTIPAGESANQAWSCVARSDTPDDSDAANIPAGSHEFAVDLPPYSSQIWLGSMSTLAGWFAPLALAHQYISSSPSAPSKSSSPSTSTRVKLEVTHSGTKPGEVVCAVGSCAEFGAWQLSNVLRFSTSADMFPIWSAEVQFIEPHPELIEYKLITLTEDDCATWEQIEGNRRLCFSQNGERERKLHLEFGN